MSGSVQANMNAKIIVAAAVMTLPVPILQRVCEYDCVASSANRREPESVALSCYDPRHTAAKTVQW
jgi:hypothetical protein